MSFAITRTSGTAFQPTLDSLAPTSKADSGSPLRNGALVERTPALARLTATDLEVIYQATGERIDENSKLIPLMAFDVASDRENGRLEAGQPIDIAYLTELLDRYERSNVEDQADQARRAIEYLAQRGGAPGVDLNA